MSGRAPSTALVRPTPVRPYQGPSRPLSRASAYSAPPQRPSSVSFPAGGPSRATYPPAGRAPSPTRPRVAFDLGGGGPPTPARPPSPSRPSSLIRPSSVGSTRPPSLSYARPRASSIPTPPPSRPSSDSGPSTSRQPPQLAFIDCTRPPPPIDSSRYGDGQELPYSNLVMARGRPRLAITYWEHEAAVEMYAALKAHDSLQRDFYARVHPTKGLTPMREEVAKDVECLVEPTLAVLRFMAFTQPGLQKKAHACSRLVKIAWGDVNEWRSVQSFYRDQCLQPTELARHNSGIVRSYFDEGRKHFQIFAERWRRSTEARGEAGRPLPPPFVSLTRHLDRTSRCFDRLKAAWSTEQDGFVCLTLRQRAQRGSASSWYFLQYRSMAFSSGIKTSLEMRTYLVKGLERYLHAARARGGISGQTYLSYFQRLQRFLPSGVTAEPRRELYSR